MLKTKFKDVQHKIQIVHVLKMFKILGRSHQLGLKGGHPIGTCCIALFTNHQGARSNDTLSAAEARATSRSAK